MTGAPPAAGATAPEASPEQPPAAALTAMEAAREAGDWRAVVAHCRALLETSPSAETLQVELGHALQESGDLDGAAAAYDAFLARHPDDAGIHLRHGHLALRRGDARAARAWYEAARVRAAPGDALAEQAAAGIAAADRAALDARRRQALALTDAGAYRAAHAALTALVEHEGCVDLTGVLGNMAKECGLLEEAAAQYARFAAWAADHGPAHRATAALQLGHLAKIRREPAAAITAFAAARAHAVGTAEEARIAAETDREIGLCLGEITASLVLWPAP